MLRGSLASVICQDQPTVSYLQTHLNTDNSLVLCGQNVFVEFLSWSKYCKAVRLDLSQEKLGARGRNEIVGRNKPNCSENGDSTTSEMQWAQNSSPVITWHEV